MRHFKFEAQVISKITDDVTVKVLAEDVEQAERILRDFLSGRMDITDGRYVPFLYIDNRDIEPLEITKLDVVPDEAA